MNRDRVRFRRSAAPAVPKIRAASPQPRVPWAAEANFTDLGFK